MGLKHFASTGLQQVKSLTSCYNGLTRGLNQSYRHTRLGCKKLHRKLRALTHLNERNKEMATAEMKRREDEAADRTKQHQSDMNMMFLMFLMILADTQRESLAQEYYFASRAEEYAL